MRPTRKINCSDKAESLFPICVHETVHASPLGSSEREAFGRTVCSVVLSRARSFRITEDKHRVMWRRSEQLCDHLFVETSFISNIMELYRRSRAMRIRHRRTPASWQVPASTSGSRRCIGHARTYSESRYAAERQKAALLRGLEGRRGRETGLWSSAAGRACCS